MSRAVRWGVRPAPAHAVLLAAASCLALAGRAAAADKSSARPNVISVPKGPGSLEGLGESFEANLNTGSARETVRLSVPPGTGGLAPQLALTYDSGQGNGPLGVGWSLGVSTIQVQTEKGLPRYDATDRFLLDGAELVEVSAGVYRQKNEGRFVRVRRTGTSWELDSPDGARSRYGLTAEARVESGGAIFSWALEEVEDRFGNRIVYGYLKEGEQPYLAQVDYNARAGAAQNQVLFHYEPRPDPATDRRARFPVTTALRLARVDVLGQGTLVRRYLLGYQAANGLSQLASVTQLGTDGATALPPVRFWYQPPQPPGQAVAVPEAGEGLPGPGDGNDEFIDLDGDGLVDLVHAEAGAHWWSPNRGPAAGFGPRQDMPWSPSISLGSPNVEVADLDGDGLPDLVARLGLTQAEWHRFPGTGQGGWGDEQVYASNPPFKLEDANVRLLDFDHDKLVDAVQSGAGVLVLWRNAGDGTWQGPFEEPAPTGFPALGLADPHLKLADLTGDRLPDLVYLLDGSTTVWASLGWGRFADPVELGASPAPGPLAEPELQLADVNGDGLSDLLWVAVDHVEWWPLLPGGSFGDRRVVEGTPLRDPAVTAIRLADLNGNGTVDVVWSTPSAPAGERLWALDLIGEARPNLLTAVENGLGKRLELAYTTSTAEFLRARAEGTPWATRVPFPVQVVAASTLSDGQGNAFRTSYAYRDGWYAPATREFRGFARAERLSEGEPDDPALREVHEFDVGRVHEALKGREVALERLGLDGTRFDRLERTLGVRRHALGLDGLTEVASAELRSERTLLLEGGSDPLELRQAFAYDDFGNLVRHERLGRVVGGDPAQGGDEVVTVRRWLNDQDGWLIGLLVEEEITDLAGSRQSATRRFYDGEDFVGLPAGQATRGALAREERWVEGGTWIPASRLAHDQYGNVVASLSPRGGRREVVWDAAGHVVPVEERVLLAARTLVYRATYQPGTQRVETFTDANGAVARFAYDALGRLTALARPGDDLARPTARFRYLLANPISQLVTEDRPRSGADLVHQSIAFYDGLGRNVADATEAGGGRWVVSERRRFSARGSVLAEWDPYFADGPGFPAADPTGAPTTYAYDGLGRRIRTTHADGTQARTTYGPLWRESWDAEDLDPASPHHDTPSRQEDDGLGRTVATVERLGARALTTRFGFDAAGRLTTVTTAAGQVTRYRFDGLGRQVGLEHPAAGVRAFGYDDDGNLTVWRDAAGQRVERDYDVVGRITSERLIAADGADQGRIAYHYDDPSPRLGGGANTLGQLSWVEDLAGQEHFAYDARGRLTDDLRVVAGTAYLTRQAFDAQDRVVRLTYPDGEAVDLEYDQRGLLVRVPQVIDAIEYDARGLPTLRRDANGVVSTASYDEHDRVKTIRATDGRGARVQDLAFGYDRVGTLRAVADAVHPAGTLSAARAYAYDDLYRLVRAQGPVGDASFAYDDVGNLLQKSDVGAYAYDPVDRPDAVRSVAGQPVEYDGNGSVVSAFGRRLTWDARGELRRVETGGAITDYTYDYQGLRTVKRVTTPAGTSTTVYVDRYSELRDGALVKYVYSGDTRVARIGGAAPRDVAAGAARRLGAGVWGLGLLAILAGMALSLVRAAPLRRRGRAVAAAGLAAVLTACPGPVAPRDAAQRDGTVYYLADHLGSSTALLDTAGAVVSRAAYDAWGKQVSATSEPYTFTGQEWDAEAGLYHLGKRYYDPRIGRFLSVDAGVLDAPERAYPDPQVLNPYAYARNTPTSLQDRDGRFPHILVGALVGAVINTGMYLAKGAINGEAYTVRGALAAAASGAVSGAVAAVTAGVGLLASGVASGVAGGIAERAVETGSVTKALDPRAMAGDAAGAVVGFGVAKAVAPLAKAVGGALKRLGGNGQAMSGQAGVQKVVATPPPAAAAATGKKSLPVLQDGCFVAGTPVRLADGRLVPIERLALGDRVAAPASLEAGAPVGAYRVVERSVRAVDVVVDVAVAGPAGGVERFTATLDHPFARLGPEGASWTEAGELAAGDAVVSGTGAGRVVSAERREARTEVYNLEVEAAHAYFVGLEPVLVHNGACGGRTGGQARLRDLADDPKLSSADRGWIRQEMNSIERGQRTTIRNPPGKQLAHARGREAAKGYDHLESPSSIQDTDLHKLQHRHDDFGRANKERP